MQYPDEFLRPITLGIPQVVNHAQRFLEEGSVESVDKFIELMLSGRLTINGEERRVLLNPRRSAVFPGSDDVTLRGDFDSGAGFSATTIPIRCPLAIYPVPVFKETLTKSIHIALTIVSDAVMNELAVC